MNRYSLILLTFILSAQIAAAQGYTPLAGVPGVDPANQSTEQYINALYILSISIASFLAVVKIIFGGVKYMLSDVVTDKGDAKKDIKGALLGLLIVLAAVLVLNTINPTLTTLNFLKDAEPLSVTLRSDGTRNQQSNVLSDYTTIAVGDRIKSCQNTDATTCASTICSPAGGAVITGGIIGTDGKVAKNDDGKAVCIIQGDRSTDTTTNQPINDNLSIDENKKYSTTEINNILSQAREAGILLEQYDTSFSKSISELQQYCDAKYTGSTAYKILKESGGAVALCVK